MNDSHCDAVICNDLMSIKNGKHRIGIFTKNNFTTWHDDNVEDEVVKFIESIA